MIQLAALEDAPVVLAGSGPDEPRLSALAADLGAQCFIVGSPSNAMLYSLYQQARAYVFPAVEDFGIMPVEAAAAGAKVLVQSLGGAAESAALIERAEIAASDRPEDLARGLNLLDGRETNDEGTIARIFGKERFIAQIRDWCEIE